MQCPKCQFDHPQQTTECLRCGIIFAKYEAYQAAVAAVAPVSVEPERNATDLAETHSKDTHELICRAVALPGALLLGWLVVWAMPLVAAFLHMWTHEGGHAVTAWLCGHMAVPVPWFTIISPERHRVVSALLGAAIAFGGYVAWRKERWFWVAVPAVVLVLLIAGNLQTDFRASMLFTFGGEGGSFVLATVLMATFYAREKSVVRRQQLRWVLIVLGAIAFLDTYAIWAGGFEKIANMLEDTDERGPSDVMQLVQLYGWPIGVMQAWYMRIAHWCFAAMATMYGAGLWQAWLRSNKSKEGMERAKM